MGNIESYCRKFRTLLASLLLVLFFTSNYGVDLLGYHQDSHLSKIIQDGEIEHNDCLICDFQGLTYDTLVQNDFGIKHYFVKYEYIFYDYPILETLSEYYSLFQQRGPPFLS